MSLAKFGKLALFFLVMGMLATPVLAEITGSEIDTFESLDTVIVTGTQAISGDDAVLLRFGMDYLGNNDSSVSGAEVTAFENYYEDYVKAEGNEYTMNAIEGTFTGMTTTFKNAEGAVTSNAAITYEYTGRIYFAGLDDGLEAYSFRIVNEGGNVNSTMTIQITVPSGYEITFHEGILAPVLSESGRTINGPTLVDTNINIGFRPVDQWSKYYVPIMMSGILCAVVIAIVALSQYRGDKGENDSSGEDEVAVVVTMPEGSEVEAPEGDELKYG